MKIEKAGIFRSVLDADYRADPCPEPSLTQSLCKILLNHSPLHAWYACPSLNPEFTYDDDTKFDIGNVAHRLLLGRGKDIEVVRFSDWRKKEAQELRDAAADRGCIAVLVHQFEQAQFMVQAARNQLEHHEDCDAFTNGTAEVMIAWQEDGIWCRALIDWLDDDLRTVTDYKTTSASVAPHVIGVRAEAAGWHIQAAFIERGLDLLDPDGAGRRRYRFVAQETAKPYALTVMHMSEHWLTMGRKQVASAMALWRGAITTDTWHGYTSCAIVPEFPGWSESRWLEREINEFSENDSKLIMAG